MTGDDWEGLVDPDDPRLMRGPSKARRYNALAAALDGLLADWDQSTNPVLLSAAGQLRLAVGKADSAAWQSHLDRLIAEQSRTGRAPGHGS